MAVVGVAVLSVSTISASPAAAGDEPGNEARPLAGTGLDVLRGDDAVDELQDSGTLDDVAAEAGFEPTDLVEELIDDPSLFLTDGGLLGYVDSQPLQADVAQASALTTQAVPADVFALSSRPTASRVIYLDFNGHVTNDPAWGPSPIVSSAFDLDGSPDTFSSAERAAIFEIWQRVTEDYAPFDVNVTTADPGVEALRRTGTIDVTFGQRVVISPTNWYAPASSCGTGQSCTLGIALVGVFDRNPTPRRSCSPPACRPGRSPRPRRTRPVTPSASTTTRRHPRPTTTATACGRRSWVVGRIRRARSRNGRRASTPAPTTCRTIST